ncbi:MAG: hypothetical protein Q8P50_11810, partial [Bacillota bacterium]|nr:hypothetical protein [Bacillota bacterium]
NVGGIVSGRTGGSVVGKDVAVRFDDDIPFWVACAVCVLARYHYDELHRKSGSSSSGSSRH